MPFQLNDKIVYRKYSILYSNSNSDYTATYNWYNLQCARQGGPPYLEVSIESVVLRSKIQFTRRRIQFFVRLLCLVLIVLIVK